MPFPSNDVPVTVLRRAARAFSDRPAAIIDVAAGQKFKVNGRKGQIPYEPLSSVIAGGDDEGVPEGHKVESDDSNLEWMPYETMRFVGKRSIYDGDMPEAAEVGVHDVKDMMGKNMKTCHNKMNKRTKTVLTDPAKNLTEAAPGVWGAAASDAADFLISLKHKLFNPDLIILGTKSLSGLQIDDDVLARITNFGGSGNAYDAEVLQWLMNTTGVRQIIYDNHLYRASQQGATQLSLKYTFEDLFWIGHKSTLVLTELNEKGWNRVGRGRDEDGEQTSYRYTRRASIDRFEKEAGLFVTGHVA